MRGPDHALGVGAIAVLVAFAATAASRGNEDRIASLAAFQRMDAVLTGPRCQNCHTLTSFPRQGDDRRAHRLNVMRGPGGHGAPGFTCATCHGEANNTASGVPGAQDWSLAPLPMGWEGLTAADRCRHLKDPARNGGRNGAAVIDHLETSLVTWAWAPGVDVHGRPRATPALSYGELLRAARTWVKTGGACPAR